MPRRVCVHLNAFSELPCPRCIESRVLNQFLRFLVADSHIIRLEDESTESRCAARENTAWRDRGTSRPITTTERPKLDPKLYRRVIASPLSGWRLCGTNLCPAFEVGYEVEASRFVRLDQENNSGRTLLFMMFCIRGSGHQFWTVGMVIFSLKCQLLSRVRLDPDKSPSTKCANFCCVNPTTTIDASKRSTRWSELRTSTKFLQRFDELQGVSKVRQLLIDRDEPMDLIITPSIPRFATK